MSHARLRSVLLAVWLVGVAGALDAFLFHRDLVQDQLHQAVSRSAVVGGFVYLLFGCVRGFTLVPSTSLVLLAVAFFRPVPLFVLTLVGILVSSASIYLFAESLHLDEVLQRRHKGRLDRLIAALRRHELPVIVGWSLFPLAPTDLICYVCGVLQISFTKCLFGVALGEGAICGIYIFLGDYVLRALHWRG